jgi:hypothetical protein
MVFYGALENEESRKTPSMPSHIYLTSYQKFKTITTPVWSFLENVVLVKTSIWSLKKRRFGLFKGVGK